jgi:hypothetical protein
MQIMPDIRVFFYPWKFICVILIIRRTDWLASPTSVHSRHLSVDRAQTAFFTDDVIQVVVVSLRRRSPCLPDDPPRLLIRRWCRQPCRSGSGERDEEYVRHRRWIRDEKRVVVEKAAASCNGIGTARLFHRFEAVLRTSGFIAVSGRIVDRRVRRYKGAVSRLPRE